VTTCFVIQPFDNAVYDKRYRDVFEPAIRAAGLEPYRVDRDPSVAIPIEDIESGIRRSAVCFAEISANNPNVWFELGFAIAAGRDVVMVCSTERAGKFPFDVQHRSVIEYNTESTSDFEDFAEKLQSRLEAAVKRREELSAIADLSPVAETEGLSQHEIIGLVSVAQGLDSPSDVVSAYYVHADMENAGFTRIAFTLAMAGLSKKGMIQAEFRHDSQDNEEYTAYSVLPKGFEWLEKNIDRLVLKVEDTAPAKDDFADIDFGGDDITF
jgi:hypothetical protein